MKPRTGLHKKIAFIFEGVPTPSTAPAAAVVGPAPAAGTADANTFAPHPMPTPSAGSVPSAPAARTASKEAAKTPSAGRNRKKNKKDAKQTQMLILVGILSVILIAVLFFVLQTPAASPKKAAAAPQTESEPAGPAEAVKWVRPEPWPETIRDPMTPHDTARTPEGGTADCVVRGIVFSRTNPSAIVGNQIVCIGDTINGIKIVNITKDTVEFEKDGRRWTQPVQQ
jgi:hypothetical protein